MPRLLHMPLPKIFVAHSYLCPCLSHPSIKMPNREQAAIRTELVLTWASVISIVAAAAVLTSGSMFARAECHETTLIMLHSTNGDRVDDLGLCQPMAGGWPLCSSIG